MKTLTISSTFKQHQSNRIVSCSMFGINSVSRNLNLSGRDNQGKCRNVGIMSTHLQDTESRTQRGTRCREDQIFVTPATSHVSSLRLITNGLAMLFAESMSTSFACGCLSSSTSPHSTLIYLLENTTGVGAFSPQSASVKLDSESSDPIFKVSLLKQPDILHQI